MLIPWQHKCTHRNNFMLSSPSSSSFKRIVWNWSKNWEPVPDWPRIYLQMNRKLHKPPFQMIGRTPFALPYHLDFTFIWDNEMEQKHKNCMGILYCYTTDEDITQFFIFLCPNLFGRFSILFQLYLSWCFSFICIPLWAFSTTSVISQ